MKRLLLISIALIFTAAACNKTTAQKETVNTEAPANQAVVSTDSMPDDETRFKSLYCHPDSKIYYNGNSKEIENITPSVDLVIDFESKTYTRLDTKGSDTYDAKFGDSGLYTNIQSLTPNGVLIRVQTEKLLENNDPFYLTYMEVVTLALDSFISHGQCSVRDN